MNETVIPIHAIKGRGTATRMAHRFESVARDAFDDGWGTLQASTPEGPVPSDSRPVTEVTFEEAKSAITRNDSPDIHFDYGLNPYRGCEHGCVYCYARPTHSYLNLSPGLDFETKIIAKRNLAAVLARKLEPRAAAPHRRLRVIRTLAEAGVPVGVSVAPQIPFINDDMEQVLAAAFEAGARSAFYTVLRLPWELNPLFRQWLALHYPQRAARVMARIQEMRGGKDYDSSFATRMSGHGVWAELIRQRFEKTCARLGMNRARDGLDATQFRSSLLSGQADLF